jgi:16S rRNA (guanine(966)-N(2))-methyltransferase RsmD
LLRIIAGRFKGRQLESPAGAWLRPTSDRMKETVFNVLQADIETAVVLDLFAGTGNLGLEALSRGARRVVLVEQDRRALGVLHRNVARLGVAAEVVVVAADAIRYSAAPEHGPFDIVIADPPYDSACEPDLLAAFDVRALRAGGWFVLQHSRLAALGAPPAPWLHVHTKRFGDTCIEFWRQPDAGIVQEETHVAP